MYEYLIPIADDSDFSLARLEVSLKQFYGQNEDRTINIERFGEDKIVVLVERFPFYLNVSDAPEVPFESAEMAAHWTGDPSGKERLQNCSRRIEMYADGRDPSMAYFNDSLYILGEIEKFDGAFIFDPMQGSFI
ncbi:MAG: hypothetical protein AAF998_20810 [Bacteroidota bacterium]